MEDFPIKSPNFDNEPGSILQRLTDDHPDQRWDAFTMGVQDHRPLDFMEEELEALLNSICLLTPEEMSGPLSKHSSPCLGMPDVTAINVFARDGVERIRTALAHQLMCFEPRLRDVRVQAIETTGDDFICRFHVTGSLWMDHQLETVSLMTEVDPEASGITIRLSREESQ